MNEFFFIAHSILISLFSIFSLKIGKEALISLMCVQAILSNLFVSKQMIIFGLCATCSDAFSVGSSLCLNLIQEYFGKQIAQKTIWISFFSLLFYVLMTQIHLIYIPAGFDSSHQHFYHILKFAPKIIIVSLLSYLISQQIDTSLYSYFRKITAGRFFILRNYGAMIIAQFIDTFIFTYVALYKIVDNPLEVLIISYVIKLITIFISIPIVGILKKKFI